MGKQITPTEQFPVPPTSSRILGTTPDGETLTLIEISEVESHVPDGSYETFVEILVHVPDESIHDSFYFNTSDYKLSYNFLQSNEDSMELLTFYQMMILDKKDLNSFVVELVRKYFVLDLGFTDVMMVRA